MNEYAPEYTKKERFILVLKYMAGALPLLLIIKYWFFPWFEGYAAKAHCYNYGVFTGLHVVFYGVFVGIPLLLAIVVFLIEGPRSIKVFKLGQNPLPTEKVFSQTKYTYGSKAKIKPLIFFVALVFLLSLSFKGVFWANDIIYNPSNDPLPCNIS
jgi:hypothetical protein